MSGCWPLFPRPAFCQMFPPSPPLSGSQVGAARLFARAVPSGLLVGPPGGGPGGQAAPRPGRQPRARGPRGRALGKMGDGWCAVWRGRAACSAAPPPPAGTGAPPPPLAIDAAGGKKKGTKLILTPCLLPRGWFSKRHGHKRCWLEREREESSQSGAVVRQLA